MKKNLPKQQPWPVVWVDKMAMGFTAAEHTLIDTPRAQSKARASATRAVMEIFAAEEPTLVISDFWPAAFEAAETRSNLRIVPYDEEETLKPQAPHLRHPAEAFSVIMPVPEIVPTVDALPAPSRRNSSVPSNARPRRTASSVKARRVSPRPSARRSVSQVSMAVPVSSTDTSSCKQSKMLENRRFWLLFTALIYAMLGLVYL